MFSRALASLIAVCAAWGPAIVRALDPLPVRLAETDAERPVDGIRDNSFLVEEAYNQEPGVVQHVGTAFYQHQRLAGADEERMDLSFTQEWPIYGQAHQLSYTVPASFAWRHGGEASGLGDVMVHYRWQAWFDARTLTALAPRASVILPTGDAARGLGEDAVGLQVNLPFSAALGARWFAHANAGATLLPDAASANGRTLRHWNVAGSVIHALSRDLHLLLEWVGIWTEAERAGGGTRHEFVSLLSPGFRKAFNFPAETQLVLGLAAPVGLTRAAPEFGVFFYASLEHPFRSKR